MFRSDFQLVFKPFSFHGIFQVQFFLILIHWLALLFRSDCGFPKFPVAIMVPQNLFMLALFGDFYYKTYIQVKSKHKKDDDDSLRQNQEDENNAASIQNNHQTIVNGNGIAKTITNGNGITHKPTNNVNNHHNHQNGNNGFIKVMNGI